MAKKFNRAAFKAARLDVNKKVAAKAESIVRSESSRGGYHSIEADQDNYFRIFPPHNPDEPSFQPKSIYWLECLVEEYIDGEPTGKKAWKKRPIFDSRVHGGTQKDIIDEYITFTRQSIYDSVQDRSEQRKLLSPITGWRGKDGKWNPGIMLSTSYVCYATKNGITADNIGRLELWKTDKEKLEELNIDENSDEPILVDMLSDPDDGVEVIITPSRDNKGKWKRVIRKREANISGLKGAANIGKAIEEFRESQMIPDEVLEKFAEMDTLKEQFQGTYKRRDFERVLEGLKRFDEQNGFNTFDHDEFIDIVKEIDSYYPDVEDAKEASKVKEDVEDQYDEEVDDSTENEGVEDTTVEVDWSSKEEVTEYLDTLNRAELKTLVKEEGINIRVVPSTKDSVIKSTILAEFFPEESEPVTEEVEEDEEENDGKSTLREQLKLRRAKKKSNEELDDLPF